MVSFCSYLVSLWHSVLLMQPNRVPCSFIPVLLREKCIQQEYKLYYSTASKLILGSDKWVLKLQRQVKLIKGSRWEKFLCCPGLWGSPLLEFQWQTVTQVYTDIQELYFSLSLLASSSKPVRDIWNSAFFTGCCNSTNSPACCCCWLFHRDEEMSK